MLDIEAIGSGGGSIAWFDQAMGFNVGPKSAGADPGPVCYGRGNEEPTITDAQLVLGRIDADSFLGGDLEIDAGLARTAIRKKLVEAVDQDRFETVEKAALAILDVANSNMYQAIREQTMQRGYDPRKYTFVAFGGAGPMHATDLADNLDMSRVLAPPSPGIASARGLLVGEIKYDNQATVSQRLQEVDTEMIDDRYDVLVQRGERQLRKDGVNIDEEASFRMSMDCLYEGQGYELNVEFDGTDGDWRTRLLERFQMKHEAEYGHYYEDNPVEVLNLRVTATADVEDYDVASLERDAKDPSHAATTESEVVFGTSLEPETRTVTRYDRSQLLAGNVVEGPAIVDEFDSTVVINTGWEATVLDDGTLEITK
jgi:N-methylhydantoinase A